MNHSRLFEELLIELKALIHSSRINTAGTRSVSGSRYAELDAGKRFEGSLRARVYLARTLRD